VRTGKEQVLDEQGARPDPLTGVSETNGAIVVRFTGELDLYNAPAVRGALRDALDRQPRRLVVDLSEVTFIDSTALGVLVEARGQLGDGERFALAALGVETRRALEVSGLERHFSVHETVESAVGPS
jgi:anti-sigma B factor antagonist